MPRRGENIRKRKDNRWEGRYVVADEGGLKKMRSVYGRNYREVKEKLSRAKQLAAEQKIGSKQDSMFREQIKITFNQAAEEWLVVVSETRKAATYVKYKKIYEKHLADPLKNLLICRMTSESINRKLFPAKTDCSSSLRRSICSVVYSVLKYSSRIYHTPLFPIECPPVALKRKRIEVYSEIEQTVLLQYLCKEMDLSKLGIVLCLSTGLRLGEACALKWEDIDFHAKILRVNRTVQRIAVEGQKSKTVLLENSPKTYSSKREIPVSDELLQLLLHFQHAHPYVLNKRKALEPRTFQNRFKRYLREAGIKERNFHTLRHTFATNCVTHGMDAKSLSEILGHSNVQITLNRYVHPSLEMKRRYMNVVSSIYGQILGQAG